MFILLLLLLIMRDCDQLDMFKEGGDNVRKGQDTGEIRDEVKRKKKKKKVKKTPRQTSLALPDTFFFLLLLELDPV